MQTFKGTVALDFKAVVPQQFLEAMREAAQCEDASPFLKQVQAQHPVNDDAFISAILKNGIRITLRQALLNIFSESYLGGTVAPAVVTITEAPPDHDAPAAIPQVITKEAV